ncbi:uncharacterized protein LOC126964981 [Leptidea sinapis]|uniref:uncharacterized protein LOC126964981 n=1 Tax=Leptidea sinapis TaxID=189913 RepID=UPI002146BC51|nr:uncharacterized protein LOC126964981 [Leptidea sinapis]
MSTRSGKRIHIEDEHNIETDIKNAVQRKTRSKKPKDNDTENIDGVSKRKHYVKYPSEEDADIPENPPEIESRKSRRHTLKELNTVDSLSVLNPIRNTRKTRAEGTETPANDSTETDKKKKKKKVKVSQIEPEDTNKVKKKKNNKKKKGKSGSVNTECLETGMLHDRSNISVESFHSAAGSIHEADTDRSGVEVANGGRELRNIQYFEPQGSSNTDTLISTKPGEQVIADNQISNIDKVFKNKTRSQTIKDKTSLGPLDVSTSPKQSKTSVKLDKKKRKKLLQLETSNDAHNTANEPKVNTTFDESNNCLKLDIKNSTYDKIDLESNSIVCRSKRNNSMANINKKSSSPNNHSLNQTQSSAHLVDSHNVSITTLNNTCDRTNKKSSPQVNTTFEMEKNEILNSTFDKPLADSSRSSLISSDASNATYDKPNDSHISVTSDLSHTEDVANINPVLIESSTDESQMFPGINIVPPTPMKREDTFTKEGLTEDKNTPKNQSAASPGRTPFPASKSSSKDKSMLNVTRSIEKSRKSWALDQDIAPKSTKVMFCSPVNTPMIVNPQKRKVIKSNLKGSNKSFVFDESVSSICSPLTRKRSLTHNGVDRLHSKRKRLTDDQQYSIDRLSRPRTTSASAKLEEAKRQTQQLTPSKTQDNRRKLPNFAALHQKQFDKMESLGECQERKARRARQMLTPAAVNLTERVKDKKIDVRQMDLKKSTPKIKLPTLESINPGYTRFGFKMHTEGNPFLNSARPEVKKPNGNTRATPLPSLAGATGRKEIARQTVMREKSLTKRRNADREENRTIIKGVRTNRRFDLQMKMRNIN